ncbi:calcium-binding protein [Streptomyces himalayensis]|uniref:Calcium-binding protein n=1 Tax=Streptomyces himalayensis subsp. himalayensis TaxID=2756131 RepID=A0A7W0I9J2_9ACTN|nr:calcium-binding protein [Streptomyces himalayensis]MBA2947343.1 calcium-binding protein [Streptomyces himalayensis subsp. himalayensis]
MRIRTAAAATAGTLALLSFLTPAAQADTSKGDTVFTELLFSKKTVNVGVSAAQTLTVTATAKDGSGIKDIYGAKLVSSDDRIIHAGSADCTRPTSTTRKCVFKFTLDADRTDYYDLKNSSAGTWHFTAEAVANDGDFYDLEDSAPVKVKRYAKLANTQASPEPVAKGGTLTVTGTLTRANWDTNVYAGYGSRSVALQFKKSGSSTYTTVKTVTTDSSGKLKTTVTANSAGTWRWKFAGSSTTSTVTAYGDGVALK